MLEIVGITMLGINVNNIAEFLPSSIPDLVCWLRPEKSLTRSKTIAEYASEQPELSRRSEIIQQHKNDLSKVVITEIISDTPASVNSFIRDETKSPTAFPELQEFPGKASSFNIGNYVDPQSKQLHTIQLISKRDFELPDNFSYFTSWNGNIKVEYSKISKKIQIYSDLLQNPPTSQIQGSTFVQDTAELMELIIYSRELEPQEKDTLEGYIAYKRNEQFTLHIDHPFLPDLTATEPIFMEIHTKLKSIEDGIQQALGEIDALYTKYKMYNGIISEHGTYKNIAIVALREINQVRRELSKGALYVRKEGLFGLNAVFQVITSQKWDKNPIFTADTIQSYIDGFTLGNNILQTYINKLRNFNPSNSLLLTPMKGGGDSGSVNTDAVNFYTNLCTINEGVKFDGNDAYNTLQTAHHRKVRDMLEILQEHIQTEIQSYENFNTAIKAWIPITNENNKKYKDTMDEYQKKITEYLKSGDYAYLINLLRKYNTLASNVANGYLYHKSHVVFTRIYVGYIDYIHRACSNYIREIGLIKQRIETCFKQHELVSNPEVEIPILEQIIMNPTQYISTIRPRYIRPMNREISILLGFEYMETTESGEPILDEKMGIVLFFPSKMDIDRAERGFLLNGKEEFIIGDEFTESILSRIHENYRPSIYIESTISDGAELDRMKKNSVTYIAKSLNTLVLPTHGLIPGDFFMIYNISDMPFCVLNSGKTPLRTLIGPQNALLFIYTAGEIPYGYLPWSTNYLPYDTLQDIPRSNYSSLISGLNTDVPKEIYVKETGIPGKFYEPIYDADWNFIEVKRWNDDKVYDIDDVNHVNPYIVNKGVPQSIDSLLLHSKATKKIHITGPIFVRKDSTTGAALLCSAKGIVPNEFGYAKCAQTPIQYIQNTMKIRGAYGDLDLEKKTDMLTRTIPIEPYLSYNLLFTSEFVSPVLNANSKIYTTKLFNPIITADGKFLETDPNFVTTEALGQPYNLYGLPMQTYAPIDFKSLIEGEEQDRNQTMVNQHVNNGKQFLISLENDLKIKPAQIKGLGNQTDGVIYSINTLSSEIGNKLRSTTKETIDAEMDSIVEQYNKIMMEFEPQMLQMKETREYQVKLDVLEQSGLSSITKHISQIQEAEQKISVITGMTEVPNIQRLQNRAEVQKTAFISTLDKIRNKLEPKSSGLFMAQKYDISDMGYLFDEANVSVHAVKQIVDNDLLKEIYNAGKEYCNRILESIRIKHDKLRSDRAFARKIALWLGVYPDQNEQQMYLSVKMPTMKKTMEPEMEPDHIFTLYENPFFDRDWPEISNKQQILMDMKTQLSDIFGILKADFPIFEGINNAQQLRDIKGQYDQMSVSIEQKMDTLRANVKVAYTILESASKQINLIEIPKIHDKMNDIRQRVKRIEEKLTALQTLGVIDGDLEKCTTISCEFTRVQLNNNNTMNIDGLLQKIDLMTYRTLVLNMDRYWNDLQIIEHSLII